MFDLLVVSTSSDYFSQTLVKERDLVLN